MALKRQLRHFFIIGIGSVLIDALTYSYLLAHIDYSGSKAASFFAGTIFAYLANKFITFRRPEYSGLEIAKFAFLYLFTLILNVGVNKLAMLQLTAVSDSKVYDFVAGEVIVSLAFLTATCVSMTCNFIGQKFWVFKT